MKCPIIPLGDRVVLLPLDEEEQQYGSIIVPDMGKDKNEHAEVIAIGPGKPTVTGEFIKTIIKPGDVVILPTMGFTKLEHKGEEYYVGPENQILAKVTKNKK